MTKRTYSTITIDRDLKKQLADRKPERSTWGYYLETELLRGGEGA